MKIKVTDMDERTVFVPDPWRRGKLINIIKTVPF